MSDTEVTAQAPLMPCSKCGESVGPCRCAVAGILDDFRRARAWLAAAGIEFGSSLLDELRADRAEPAILPGETTKPSPPDPSGVRPEMWDLVQADMRERDHFGRRHYGQPIDPNDGRDWQREAYEELLDAAIYQRTALYKRDGK